ncbi:MAG TPA: response regulator [Thermoanaerobaculia bacterium]|jgi:CheY-like chemotaxis protein
MLPDDPLHSVLVIDDDPTILLLLGAVARRNGLVCVTASDGESALTHIRGGTFDVILLDLNLPAVDGFEVLRIMREETPHLLQRTIVVSGAPREMLDELRAKAGVWRVVRKPVDIRDLEGEVMACLGEHLIRQQMER